MNQQQRKQRRAKVKFDDMPRGKQVEYLMKPENKGGEGMDATAVAKALKISRNAVYQQIRKNRLKAGGGTAAKKATGKSGSTAKKGATSRRQSAATPPPPAPAAPTPEPVAADATPEQVIQSRLTAIDGEITTTEAEIKALSVLLDGDGDKQPGLRAEQGRLSRALAALLGEPMEGGKPVLTPPAAEKPRRGGRRGKGGEDKANGAAPAEQPAEATAAPADEAEATAVSPAEQPAADSTAAPAVASAPPADDPFEGQGETTT